MFSLFKIKCTKKLIVVESNKVSRKKKKEYWIKLENGKRCVGIFLCKSDERHTLLEIKKSIDTNSPKIIMEKIDKLNIQHANSKITQSNSDINIKKSLHDQLDKENEENINPQSTTITLKRNAKIFSSECSNSETEYKNTKKFGLNVDSSVIQDNTINQKSIYDNQFDKENNENINPQSTTIALKRNAEIFSSQYSNSETEYENTKKIDFLNIDSSVIQDNNTTNKKSIYNNQFDNEQFNIINDDFVSNTEMINKFHNQYEHPNIINSYLDLNVQSDVYYNDEVQTNIVTNSENLGNEDKTYELDKTKSSRNYPRIVENRKCKINMTILSKKMNLTDSFNISNLDNSLELFDILNNNDELYYNPQIANVSQHTDNNDEDPDYELSIYSQSLNNNPSDIENKKNYEIDDLKINKSDEIRSRNCSENKNSLLIENEIRTCENDELFEKEIRICKDDELFVELSRGPKGDKKSNFCVYCNTMQTKIARHLELKHRNEEKVKKFLSLPKKSRERREAINQIRKKGNFEFNTQADLNSGSMIVVRRPTKKEKQCGSHFLPCSNCKGHYSISNLRHHYRICAKKKDTVRNILKLGRSAAQSVHNRASFKLRKDILPIMRNDNIYNLIKYDLLIILYGNYLCQIHRLQHLGDHIRQQLRLIGRYLEALKSIEPKIEELQMLFDPKYYEIAIQAVNVVAKYNEDTGSYEIPYNATALGTCLKKLCKILINECIKQYEYEKQKLAENFLKILEVEYGSIVNKTVIETRTRNNRKKIVNLPKTSDIKKLTNYLEKERISNMRKIENDFTFDAWKSLAEVILILIQIFNRRRAGEIERAYIIDYKNFMKITKEDELYKRLPEKEKKSALKYVRFTIRGKLNRNVPVLLNAKMKETIEIILNHREMAGVSSKNPYIFGLPNTDERRFRYLRASKLMREFSNICGAKNKTSLRGTILRKDMATKCAHLPDTEISLIADFMGHHKDIHKNIYRQPVAKSDILNMAKILEKTQNISAHNTTNTDTSNTTTNSIISNSTMNTNTSENSIDGIQNTDETLESDTLPIIKKNLKKAPLKRKNINKSPIENDSSLDDKSVKKKKRFTPPYGNTIRIRWTEEEKETALFLFEKYINNFTLPSLKEIASKTRDNILKNRQPATIKTWLHNQIRAKNKRNKNVE